MVIDSACSCLSQPSDGSRLTFRTDNQYFDSLCSFATISNRCPGETTANPFFPSSQGYSLRRFAAFPPECPKSASHQEGPRPHRFHLHRYVPKPVSSLRRGPSVLPVAKGHCLPFHPRAPLIPAG